MAVGKNKRLSKGGKKGTKKKVSDVMTRKEWYDVVAPAAFQKRHACKTLVNKSVGNKYSVDYLKGRVFEVNLGDLMQDEQAYGHRKITLKVEDIQGRNCITNYHGMDLTTDRLRSLVKKWCTLIEGQVDVKTTDGYTLRIFCIGFTKKRPAQVKKNCHAKSSQVRQIRQIMIKEMTNQIAKSDLAGAFKKFGLDVIGKEIEKACNRVFPMRDVTIRKVKIVKSPKFDPQRLMEVIHSSDIPASREEIGVAV